MYNLDQIYADNAFKPFVDAVVENLKDHGIYYYVDSYNGKERTIDFQANDFTLATMKRLAEILGTDRISVESEYEGDYSEVTPGAGQYNVLRVKFPND